MPPFRANPPPVGNPDYNSRKTSSRSTEKYNQAPYWTAFPNYGSRMFTGNFIHTQGEPKPAKILGYREHPHWQLQRHLGKPQTRKMTFSALKPRQKVPTRHSTAIYIVWGTSKFMITELTTSTFRTHLTRDSIFLNPISIYATKLSSLKIFHATCLDLCMFPAPNFRCIVLSALTCHFYRRSERVQIHRRTEHRICGSTCCAFITTQ
jgi:hypothetical protein